MIIIDYREFNMLIMVFSSLVLDLVRQTVCEINEYPVGFFLNVPIDISPTRRCSYWHCYQSHFGRRK